MGQERRRQRVELLCFSYDLDNESVNLWLLVKKKSGNRGDSGDGYKLVYRSYFVASRHRCLSGPLQKRRRMDKEAHQEPDNQAAYYVQAEVCAEEYSLGQRLKHRREPDIQVDEFNPAE